VTLRVVVVAVAICGTFWAGYRTGERVASSNYEWVLRGLEEDGAIWIHGDFDMLGARKCQP
jgi:hypothetical protein